MSRRGHASSVSEAFSGPRADYGAAHASRYRRTRNLPAGGAGADYHVRSQTDCCELVEFARDMEHNAPLVRQGLRRLVANCNPGQMTPDPATGDREVDQHLMRRWWAWSESPRNCHAARKLAFRRMTNVAFTRVVVDGDVFGLPLENGTIQTLEADRCRTPNRARTRGGVCGVEKTELGAPLRYWFTRQPYDGLHALAKVLSCESRTRVFIMIAKNVPLLILHYFTILKGAYACLSDTRKVREMK